MHLRDALGAIRASACNRSAPVKALKETTEADAYATSAARRPVHELKTPLEPGDGTSDLVEVDSSREVALKIVPQPPRQASSSNSKKSYWVGGSAEAVPP